MVTYQQNACPGQRYPVVSMYRPIPGVHTSTEASPLRPQLAPSQASRNQPQIHKEQKPGLTSAPAFTPRGDGGCWFGTQAYSQGSGCRGLSWEPALHAPPAQEGSPGHSWDDSDRLMGSRSGLLFFLVVI